MGPRRLSKPIQHFGWLLACGWSVLAAAKFRDFLYSERRDLALPYGLMAAAFFICSTVLAYRAFHPNQSGKRSPDITTESKANS